MKLSVLPTLTVLTLLAAPIATVQAREWHFGVAVAYPSGTGDVLDLYEANNAAILYPAGVKQTLPVGLAFDAHYQWDSGIRAGMGAGPLMMIFDDAGNAAHVEFSVNGTVGYSFIPQGTVSPYIKLGLVSHGVSGDYVVESSPGLLAAAGIEVARKSVVNYAFEIAVDQSQVEFEKLCYFNQRNCRDTTETINTFGVVVSFIVKFGRSRTP